MRVRYRAAYYMPPDDEQAWAVLTGPGEMGLSDGELIEAALVAAERSRLAGVPWQMATPVQILERIVVESSDDLQEYFWETGSYWFANTGEIDVTDAISVCAGLCMTGGRLGRRTRAVYNEWTKLREMAQMAERRKK